MQSLDSFVDSTGARARGTVWLTAGACISTFSLALNASQPLDFRVLAYIAGLSCFAVAHEVFVKEIKILV